MTIPSRPAPSRPAPAPPSSSMSNWNGRPNPSATSSVNKFVNKKAAPPRPPPPKVQAPVKSTDQPQTKFFSNIFGASKKNNNKSTEKLSQFHSQEFRIPPKIPAPPVNLSKHHTEPIRQHIRSDMQLINFDESPPSSPPSIKKSNTGSDSVSIDSYCSSNSSPNNLNSGTTSQAESGFEDDFSVSDFKVTSGMTSRSTTFSNGPFDLLGDFDISNEPQTNTNQTNIRNLKPAVQAKPLNIGSANFYACTSTITTSNSVFDDTLSNGKNLIKPQSVSMPTIIKPAGKVKTSPVHVPLAETKKSAPTSVYKGEQELTTDSSFDDDLPSPPMPTIPPPPPPVLESFDDSDVDKISHGIALFDYESEVVEDLNFRANEKIYLLKQMNDEWMYGRNKRGCEGIFPITFVDIRVPLKAELDSGTASRSESVSPAAGSHRVRALYSFNAETDEDLTIMENEMINVMYEINGEWLYGTNSRGDYGQFPANFIEYVPANLPSMPK